MSIDLALLRNKSIKNSLIIVIIILQYKMAFFFSCKWNKSLRHKTVIFTDKHAAKNC